MLDLAGFGDGPQTLSYADFAAANCGDVAGATCVRAFQSLAADLKSDRDLTNTLATLGLAGGLIATVATPELAALCLASPTCKATYVAAESAGTLTDLAACAGGDSIACAAAAVPVVTTGGTGGIGRAGAGGAEAEAETVAHYGPLESRTATERHR